MTCHDAPLRGTVRDRYETWGAGQTHCRETAEKQRRAYERDDRLTAVLLIADMVTGGALAAIVVALAMTY